MVKIGIAGASGYAGNELIRLLLTHPEAQITYLGSESCAGRHIGSAFPGLLGHKLPDCAIFDAASIIENCDVLFLARSGYFSSLLEILDNGVKIISVPGDFRFKDTSIYEKWYGKQHPSPEVAARAVYGATELHRDEVAAADLIANPGCYAVASILAVAPLVAKDLVKSGSIIIDAKSGVSGAGRTKTEQAYLFSELDQNVRAYRVANHQHTPEIEQELSRLSGRKEMLSFTPHLIPMTRGILTTCYGELANQMQTEDVLEIYREFYADAPFVIVLPKGEYPATKNTLGSNFCHIGLEADPRTGRIIVMSAIDNLGKGAAGQAIQNMNVMFGMEETVGLMIPPVYP